jgi:hypothetical protein
MSPFQRSCGARNVAAATSEASSESESGLARYWFARTWTTAFAAILWLAWLYT